MALIKNIFLLSLLTLSSLALANSPIGYWQLNDANGNPVMIIRIFQEGQSFGAKLIEYYPNRNAICSACEGKNAGKPIRGMVLISGLVANGENSWSGGRILNPLTGKVNKASMTLNAAGTALSINNYGFLSWFGSSDIWVKRK